MRGPKGREIFLCLKLSTEKLHNLKVESYILFGGLAEDTDISEERGERRRIYRSFAAKTR